MQAMDRQLIKGCDLFDKFLRLQHQNRLIWGWMQLKKHYRRSLRPSPVPSTLSYAYKLIPPRKSSHTYTEHADDGSDRHSTTTHQPKMASKLAHRSRYTERKERRVPSAHAQTEMSRRRQQIEEDDGFERLVMEKLARLEENMNGWIEGGSMAPKHNKVKKTANLLSNPYLSKQNRGHATTLHQQHKTFSFRPAIPPHPHPKETINISQQQSNSNSPSANFRYIPAAPQAANRMQHISRVVRQTQEKWIDEMREAQVMEERQQKGQISRIRNCREGRLRPQVHFGPKEPSEDESQRGSEGSRKKYKRSPPSQRRSRSRGSSKSP